MGRCHFCSSSWFNVSFSFQKCSFQNRQLRWVDPGPKRDNFLSQKFALAFAVLAEIIDASDVTTISGRTHDFIVIHSPGPEWTVADDSARAGPRLGKFSPSEFFRPREEVWLDRHGEVAVVESELVHHHHKPVVGIRTGKPILFGARWWKVVNKGYEKFCKKPFENDNCTD